MSYIYGIIQDALFRKSGIRSDNHQYFAKNHRGGVIGFILGLLGIDGGVFIVPLLIYILRVPTKIAAATSIFIQ
ncbi:sulfite exporter TauE/SafE family protein [Desulfosarcina sp. BuS5]|uniref:TSUP family transporter n=1 Tax=Desulfosarcina sp. BuS5 TaxID=933262 RepID=UPI0009FD3C8D